MKKILFGILFTMALCVVYGQMRTENRWIIGRWTANIEGENVEIIFNDNGTSKINADDYVFSINGDSLKLFASEGNDLEVEFIVYRISDQRMILYTDGEYFNFTKR